ncbi:MAG TPA: septation protein SepH, partial [Microlunatus sp.]|nr:septation protein SepH [Microlunatus sp.]
MRVARLVGLSPDGRFVIVATERGEELAIAADDRLRAALRGDRPRLGQLEIEMESALSPREIQTRIRSGESVDDIARVAGIERDRVERFAAPVIAEREHVAGLAMGSSARRRGETSSHRTLRGVLTERLLSRGVDIATVRWDSYRLDDGRWAVTADYRSGETPRQALFFFDLPGRYSVAGNDDGRWVLGDSSPSRGPQPGRLPPAPGEPDDTEPTLDLSDELALVRAIQDVPTAGVPDAEPSEPESTSVVERTGIELRDEDVRIAEVVQLTRVSGTAPADVGDLDPELSEVEAELDRHEAEEPSGSGLDALQEIFEDQDPSVPTTDTDAISADQVVDLESAEPTVEVDRGLEEDGADEGPVEDSAPSDASAVPELRMPLLSDAWEPAIVVDYP